jgi:hypothetical protein
MAFKHGKNAVFKVDNSSGSITDISAYAKEVSLPRKVDTAETTTYGKDSKTYIVGLKDGTVSVSGMWDATLDAHLAGILGQDASVTFEYGPAGSATGAVKFTGEAFLTSYETSSPVGDVVTFSAEFQCSDSITRTTF